MQQIHFPYRNLDTAFKNSLLVCIVKIHSQYCTKYSPGNAIICIDCTQNSNFCNFIQP